MLTKEATSSTVVATSSGFLFVTLRLPFWISANVVAEHYSRQMQTVGGIYVLYTVIGFSN